MLRIALIILTFIALNLSLWGGFSIEDGVLFDSNGKAFVFRGVNLPHAWFRGHTNRALKRISKTGANSVRVVFSNGDQWKKTSARELKKVLRWCEANELIAIVEIHDTTGFGDKKDAVTLDAAVDYWLEVKDILNGNEDRVILNIANEPFGNNAGENAWVEQHVTAIQRLRAAGFQHTLMVDAANWGQDWQGITLTRAREVFEADKDKNTVFSVHMYEVYGSEEKVKTYLKTFVDNKLCLVVGEFSMNHYGKPVDAEAIMRWANHYQIGYLGWSWCGNHSDLKDLDIVENWKNPSEWGELLINSEYGIRATSKKASIFTLLDAPINE